MCTCVVCMYVHMILYRTLQGPEVSGCLEIGAIDICELPDPGIGDWTRSSAEVCAGNCWVTSQHLPPRFFFSFLRIYLTLSGQMLCLHMRIPELNPVLCKSNEDSWPLSQLFTAPPCIFIKKSKHSVGACLMPPRYQLHQFLLVRFLLKLLISFLYSHETLKRQETKHTHIYSLNSETGSGARGHPTHLLLKKMNLRIK